MFKIRFVVNPISGINRNPGKIVYWIERAFRDHSSAIEIVLTRQRGHAVELAREAVEKGYNIVVAVGGDGTINEVGRGLVSSNTALGVIPAGSGNGFARNFQIPLDQREAIDLLLAPAFRSIDVGKINEHYFFNVAGSGLDAEISKNFEEFGMRGPVPYFLVGTKAMLAYQPKPLKIVSEEFTDTLSPLIISIANGPQYGNGAIIAPAAKPDDGFLDVCIIDPIPLWKAVPNLYRLFNGTIDEFEGYRSFQTRSLTIERSEPGTIQTDGDPHEEEAVLKIEVLPKSLRVAVPPRAD